MSEESDPGRDDPLFRPTGDYDLGGVPSADVLSDPLAQPAPPLPPPSPTQPTPAQPPTAQPPTPEPATALPQVVPQPAASPQVVPTPPTTVAPDPGLGTNSLPHVGGWTQIPTPPMPRTVPPPARPSWLGPPSESRARVAPKGRAKSPISVVVVLLCAIGPIVGFVQRATQRDDPAPVPITVPAGQVLIETQVTGDTTDDVKVSVDAGSEISTTIGALPFTKTTAVPLRGRIVSVVATTYESSSVELTCIVSIAGVVLVTETGPGSVSCVYLPKLDPLTP